MDKKLKEVRAALEVWISKLEVLLEPLVRQDLCSRKIDEPEILEYRSKIDGYKEVIKLINSLTKVNAVIYYCPECMLQASPEIKVGETLDSNLSYYCNKCGDKVTTYTIKDIGVS